MSFSGRLNNGNGGTNNVVPLSISSHALEGEDKFSLPLMMARGGLTSSSAALASALISEDQKQALVQDLIESKSRLLDQSKAMKQLKEAHEAQLVALSRQLLELECGLRKRERELCALLKQRDQVIREQSHIIRFLTKKTGTKRRDILSLADEAAAKIPQWPLQEEDKKKETTVKSEQSLVTNKSVSKAKSEVTLTSILESESENDSAVILDELASPTASKGSNVSRSVSDVMSSSPEEAEMEPQDSKPTPFASPNYRGFLLRHGSYERYKIRSRMLQLQQQHVHHQPEYSTSVTANATLPRNRKLKKDLKNWDASNGLSSSTQDLSMNSTMPVTKAASTTVIVINGNTDPILNPNVSPAITNNQGSSNAPKSNNSHRSVTKPRDVKNKSNSNRSKMILKMGQASPPHSKSPSPPILTGQDNFIQQSGSVYCSLYGDLSEDDISYA